MTQGDTLVISILPITEEYGDLLSEYDGAATLYHTYDALGSTDALLNDAEAATDRYA